MQSSNFKIGADPELFFMDAGNHKFISSIGLVGGSKIEPKSVGHGCFVQEDNVAVEFNIPACETLEEFQSSIAYSLKELNHVAEFNDLRLATNVASAIFTDDQLNCQAALVFGCDPDYNAWTDKINPKPNGKNKNLRSCGGHVHIGVDDLSSKDKIELIKLMDLYLGIPSVILDPDTERKKLYGKAGAFRFKKYGAEYRVLSNFWIWKKEYVELVFNNTKRAVEALFSGTRLDDKEGKKIQTCINNGDVNVAREFDGTYKLI
jgi:hypothetical protein